MLYYIDGYHGGIRGHMPLGCWRDILEMLKKCPEWKLCIDVEPISFDELQHRDPAAYDELNKMIQSADGRLELVSGSYGQCYGYLTDGESNIRHLLMGIDKLREHFPDAELTTFAVQEPCWTSSLPQILLSLGFKRAALKNPSTAWGGYCEGFDDELFVWEGPDGSQIPTVPRYACEKLQKAWETESVDATLSFTEKCINAGISHPTGMIFQDLGWPSLPRLGKLTEAGTVSLPPHVLHVTWKEYFEHYANTPAKVRKITQESFLCALPWGEQVLTAMARQVRKGEGFMLKAERIHAMTQFLRLPVKGIERIREGWHHVLMAQHHDGWICAPLGKYEDNWAFKGAAQVYAANGLVEPVVTNSLISITSHFAVPVADRIGEESVFVFNPLTREESRFIEVPVTSFPGTQTIRVFDGDQELSTQYIPERTYFDGSMNAGTLCFRASLPAFGFKNFRLQYTAEKNLETTPVSVRMDREFVYLESDLYAITLDLRLGGVITQLYDKTLKKDIIANDEKYFNEYTGYFIREGRFCSSCEHPAQAEIIANGPVKACIRIHGQISNVPFSLDISLAQGEKAIPMHVVFHFPEKTYIGEPHEIIPSDNKEERHRSYHDSRYKLCAHFPTVFSQKHLFKDAAYDVCESKHENTHFKRWDEIKHNILLNWVDVNDGERGLCLMCDHTTSYSHGTNDPLALTLAWGWDGGYWWGRRELKGDHDICYTLLPHAGTWQQGDVWHEFQKLQHIPASQRVSNLCTPCQHSLIHISGKCEGSAVYASSESQILLRLFAPEADDVRIDLPDTVTDCCLTELDGRIIKTLSIQRDQEQPYVRVSMPAFAIRTLLIEQSEAQKLPT